ncbi:MAG: REP-associated tyrosine transposase [Chloroflexota bacterium]
MTTRWRPDFDPDHLYFITTTAADHAHIFRRDVIKRILVDSLYYISLMNRVILYAFVIMPNHIHVIIQCPADFPPKGWTRAFKAGTARLIVRQYQVEGNSKALHTLRAMVTRPTKQQFKVWEDSYWAENIFTPAFLDQKLSYIHNNPVQSHWQLAEMPEGYPWSSARYYLQDEPALIPLEDGRALLV